MYLVDSNWGISLRNVIKLSCCQGVGFHLFPVKEGWMKRERETRVSDGPERNSKTFGAAEQNPLTCKTRRFTQRATTQ